MEERIVLGVVIVLAVGAILFLGSGITGLVVSDAPNHDMQKDTNNIYIGLILLITMMLFLLTVYGKYFTGEHHRHN